MHEGPVIASNAKQSRAACHDRAALLDCFVAAYHSFENAHGFATLCTRVPYIFQPFVPDRLTSANLNLYGVLGLFGLVGLYAPQAVAAMRGIAENLLGVTAAGVGLVRPQISGLEPPSVRAGSGSALVRVRGANFDAEAVVTVNGAARRSVFAGTAEMIVYLEPSDTAGAGFLRLMVHYPPPSDVASAEILLPVYSAGGEHA